MTTELTSMKQNARRFKYCRDARMFAAHHPWYMSIPRVRGLWPINVILMLIPPAAHGESIWQAGHYAAGYGIADLNGGLPPYVGTGQTFGPGSPSMSFTAFEDSQLGSLGASAGASGISAVNAYIESMISLTRLVGSYFPSFAPGGDRPGGMAAGSLSSIIEFVMPADLVQWDYYFRVEDGPYFSGQTQSMVQNLSRQQTLVSFDDPIGYLEGHTMLPGTAGDVIRITTTMSAAGSVPPNVLTGFALYDAMISMEFTIVPEPSTLLMAVLLAGLAVPVRRRGNAPPKRRQ